MTVAIQLQIHT